MIHRVLKRLKAATPDWLVGEACWVIGRVLYVAHLPVLRMLSPRRRLRFALIRTDRVGHLALEPELFLRRQATGGGRQRERTLFIREFAPPANEQLLRMWERRLPIVRWPVLYYIIRNTRRLWLRSPWFTSTDCRANEYRNMALAAPSLAFTEEEESRGRQSLRGWGIDADRDWFVCVLARDDRYLRAVDPTADASYHDYRNVDIDSFALAIEEIVARGGFVLRMGFHVEKPLRLDSPRVIDYASEHRSDFMDVYLPAKCRFFLGSASGISEIAVIFDRPRVGIGLAPFGSAPIGKDGVFIPKRLVRTADGESYTFEQLLRDFAKVDDPKAYDGRAALEAGYRYVDNTPEEIRDATREMLDRLDGAYVESEEGRELRRRYRASVPRAHWCYEVGTPVAESFLKRHEALLR